MMTQTINSTKPILTGYYHLITKLSQKDGVVEKKN